jgi:hypothetical protein
MKLVNLIPLKEIDFRNQDAFDAYQKQHSLRPDTKVTIAGKPTTAGQAAQKTGSSVFGKDKGGDVFGKSDSMATVNSIAAKTGLRAQAVAGWADENGVNLSKVSADIDSKKLKPMDLMTAVVGNPNNKYAKDIIAKYSQSGGNATSKKSVPTKFAAWFTGTVLNGVKHPVYGKNQLTPDQLEKAPAEYKNKLFKSIEKAIKNGDITPDIIKKNS